MPIEEVIDALNAELIDKCSLKETTPIDFSFAPFDLTDPLLIDEIEKLESYVGRKLPEDFLDYQKLVIDIRSMWRYRNADTYISGNESIQSLLGIITATDAYFQSEDTPKQHPGLLELLQTKEYFVFSTIEWNCILVKFERDTHHLYLFLPNDPQLHLLSIKAPDYVRLFLETKGMLFWSLYKTVHFPESIKKLGYDGFFENMTHLFPNVHLNQFDHRELFDPSTAANLFYAKWQYRQRLAQHFHQLPAGCEVLRYDPSTDLLISPPEVVELYRWQIVLEKRFPADYRAFNYASMRSYMRWKEGDKMRANFRIEYLTTVYKESAAAHYGLDAAMFPHLADKYVWYTDPYHDILIQHESDDVMAFFLMPHESNDQFEAHFITDSFDWLITRLMETRGVFFWAYFLTFKHLPGDPDFETFKATIERLFPDADLSPYEKLELKK